MKTDRQGSGLDQPLDQGERFHSAGEFDDKENTMINSIDPNTVRDEERRTTRNYRFQAVWWTAAAPEPIWQALADYAAWPGWWRGIRNVEVLRRGDESGVGTVLRQRWRSRLPYTLVLDLEMVRIESQRLLDGRASGDLVGSCAWTLVPVNGGTEIHFNVDVGMGRWWMNLPIPFAPRVVRANFETLMNWGRRGLGQRLGIPVDRCLG